MASFVSVFILVGIVIYPRTGDPWPSPSNWFLLMTLQSRELNQEIEEFLYVL